jgi:putative transposase
MPGYRTGAHTVYDIKYHVVWVTKYRHAVLRGEIAVRARGLVRDICMEHDVRILQGHVSREHVHLYRPTRAGRIASHWVHRVWGDSDNMERTI